MDSRPELPKALDQIFEEQTSDVYEQVLKIENFLLDPEGRKYLRDHSKTSEKIKDKYRGLLHKLALELNELSVYLFTRLDDADIGLMPKDEDKKEKAQKIIGLSNSITEFISSELVCNNVDKRALLMERWLAIEQILLNLGNYDTSSSITNAFLKVHVDRMRAINSISSAAREFHEALFVSNDGLYPGEEAKCIFTERPFCINLVLNRADTKVPSYGWLIGELEYKTNYKAVLDKTHERFIKETLIAQELINLYLRCKHINPTPPDFKSFFAALSDLQKKLYREANNMPTAAQQELEEERSKTFVPDKKKAPVSNLFNDDFFQTLLFDKTISPAAKNLNAVREGMINITKSINAMKIALIASTEKNILASLRAIVDDCITIAESNSPLSTKIPALAKQLNLLEGEAKSSRTAAEFVKILKEQLQMMEYCNKLFLSMSPVNQSPKPATLRRASTLLAIPRTTSSIFPSSGASTDREGDKKPRKPPTK